MWQAWLLLLTLTHPVPVIFVYDDFDVVFVVVVACDRCVTLCQLRNDHHHGVYTFVLIWDLQLTFVWYVFPWHRHHHHRQRRRMVEEQEQMMSCYCYGYCGPSVS